MRLAYFSPLNPVPSGISDYSEELLPYLAHYADIELVINDDPYGKPTNRALDIFPQRTLREFQARVSGYDVVLYQMGNSPAHAAIFETLFEIPGVVVMHDVVLHHLRAWLTLEHNKPEDYRALMQRTYGAAGATAAELEIQRQVVANRFEFPLNEDVVRAARGLITHSDYAAQQIQPLAPTTPLAVIPMGISLPEQITRADARAALGLPDDTFLVMMFGEVQPQKRVLPVLNAFTEFHARVPNSRLLLVGRGVPLFDAREALAGLGIADAVEIVGYVPQERYGLYLAAADVCLNLRYPTAGETSASLLRLLAAGQATFVTRAGAYAELPDDVCVKIEPDAYEQPLLVTHLEYLYAHPEARAALGARARRYVAEQHTLAGAAQGYADFLKQFVSAI